MGFGQSIASNFTGKGSVPGSRPEVLGTDVIGVPGELGGFGAGAYGPLRVPAKYYLEIRNNNSFQYMTCMPYDPQFVEIQRASPTVITETLSGTIREFGQQKKQTIVLRGRSGKAVRTAYNRNGGVIYQDGDTIFKEFDEFLKQYNFVQKSLADYTVNPLAVATPHANARFAVNSSNKSPSSQYMVLRCIDEDAHFKVEPISFTYGRNIETNRFDFNYTLVLQAYDYAYDSKQYNPILGAFDAVDNVVGMAGGFVGIATNLVNNVSNDYIRGLGDAFRNVGTIIDATNELANSFGNLGDTFHYVGASYCDTVKKFCSFTDAWKNIAGHYDQDEVRSQDRTLETSESQVELEVQQYAQVKGLDDKIGRVLEQYSYAIEAEDNVSDEMALLLSRIQAEENFLKNSAEVLRGSIRKKFFDEYKNSLNTEYVEGRFLLNENNYDVLSKLHNDRLGAPEPERTLSGREIVLQADEDLKKVALKYLGDAELAYDIQLANGWLDIRRKADGSFVQSGDTVILPNSVTSLINPTSEDGPIAGDIRLPFDDIEFNVLTGDLQITNVFETLEQTLRTILLTAEGELNFEPQFGVPQIIKTEFDPQLIAVLIRESIIAHPYFADVTDIVTEISDDSIVISCTVTAIDGTVIPLRTPGEL